MKTKEKLRGRGKTKEITKTILKIAAAGGLAIIAGGGSHNPKMAIKVIGGFADYSLSRVKECLKRLSLQNYIKYDENDLVKPIILTEKGMQRYTIQTLKDRVRACTMKKWDHIWRLVTFDVKEKYRCKRDGFRESIKKMNFFQFQKNIFINPFPIEAELEALIKSFKMWDSAVILHVADLGKREDEVKKYFLEQHKIGKK